MGPVCCVLGSIRRIVPVQCGPMLRLLAKLSVQNARDPANTGGNHSAIAYRPVIGFLDRSVTHSSFIFSVVVNNVLLLW